MAAQLEWVSESRSQMAESSLIVEWFLLFKFEYNLANTFTYKHNFMYI